MKTVGASLTTHLAAETQTLATCWKVTLKDATVLGFTDHDTDLVLSGVTYLAASGYSATDVQTTAALAVDNMDLAGILSSPAITEDDLRAGVWDFAAVEMFTVNWANLAHGRMWQRVGWLGEVSIDRGTFKTELRGLAQAYSRNIVELTSPACRAHLGDTRCGVALGPFTVTGSIDSVNDDNITMYDAARVEAGPTGGFAVTGVTNANPGVVSFAAGPVLVDGQIVTLSGIVGPSLLNVMTIVRNPTTTSFELGIDTSDTGVYPAYSSGGTITPAGANSGYFDHGVITFTSGLNNGLAMEIKAYTVGQITLQLPMPYLVVAGDTYSIHAGCDKAIETCRDRFDNVVNFRGEPWLRGVDQLVQVGRR